MHLSQCELCASIGFVCTLGSQVLIAFCALCRSEFVFNNPNSKGSCGCGESFTT